MEEVVQSEVLINKYKRVVKDLARKRAQIWKISADDLIQEGFLGLFKGFKHLVKNDNVTTAWYLASSQMRKHIRGLTGVKLRTQDADHSKVMTQLVISDGVGDYDGEEEHTEAFVVPSVEQPSLEDKDLLEKLRKTGLEILSGPEFNAVFDFDSESENKHLANQNRYRGINKLKKAVGNWK